MTWLFLTPSGSLAENPEVNPPPISELRRISVVFSCRETPAVSSALAAFFILHEFEQVGQRRKLAGAISRDTIGLIAGYPRPGSREQKGRRPSRRVCRDQITGFPEDDFRAPSVDFPLIASLSSFRRQGDRCQSAAAKIHFRGKNSQHTWRLARQPRI
jgi:hypothetical protein